MKITRRAALRSLAGAGLITTAAGVATTARGVATTPGSWASICASNAPVGWSNMHAQPLTIEALRDAVRHCERLMEWEPLRSDGPMFIVIPEDL